MKVGNGRTFLLDRRPTLSGWASIAGKKEGEGPLGHAFDRLLDDDLMGEKSWEKAECRMFRETVELALTKAGVRNQDVDVLVGGDLLNQIITASFAARDLELPFLGLYGACSTMAESLLVAGMMVDGGYARQAVCATSSHFSTAERQYRLPLEHGNQRPPSTQWTVTGSGAVMLRDGGIGPRLRAATAGRVIDLGVTDANNMGAAMAPSAVDTIAAHLRGRGQRVDAYDAIVTGDLGKIGAALTRELGARDGLELGDAYMDCGCEIFLDSQDTHAGGSGCGCSAVTLCGWLLPKLQKGEWKRMLFVATGALLSPTSSLQGESIPGVAHAVEIVAEEVED